jgi:hypothetical protein
LVSGDPRAVGVLSGRVVFKESGGSGFAESEPGQGVVRALWQGDVIDTVDFGRRNTYSFQLWPGMYSVRAGAERPPGNDDFCTLRVRIKANQTRRAIVHCTPSEDA